MQDCHVQSTHACSSVSVYLDLNPGYCILQCKASDRNVSLLASVAKEYLLATVAKVYFFF